MSNPSNLYAEKVFSEHPTVLWALDDTADYISLITEAQRSFTSWTVTPEAPNTMGILEFFATKALSLTK